MHPKREHKRVSIDAPIQFERAGGEASVGLAKDISMGGMYIEAEVDSLPEFGSKLTIVGNLGGMDMKLPCVVRWVNPEGFGVQFGLLGARETHTIARLLKG